VRVIEAFEAMVLIKGSFVVIAPGDKVPAVSAGRA